MSVPTVDVHAHAGVPAVDALIEGQPGLVRQREIDAATLGRASLAVNLKQIAELGPKLVDLELRLAAMDAARVQVQAVSAVPLPMRGPTGSWPPASSRWATRASPRCARRNRLGSFRSEP